MFRVEETVIYLSGPCVREMLPEAETSLKRIKRKDLEAVKNIDLSEVERIDSAGAVFINGLRSELGAELISVPETVKGVLDIFSASENAVTEKSFRDNILVRAGEHFLRFADITFNMLVLTSDIFTASLKGVFNSKRRRKGSVTQQAVILGLNAFGIIALLSFIIGLILAMQGAAQLRQFGASIFVADLIAVSMVREMGPMMTAIIVAGRSGSAIASEIATMKISEELDALKMMALDPVHYVIAPKFLAITFTMPMLVMISIVVGMAGGLVVGITYLDLPATAYILESFYFLTTNDLAVGLSKSVFFAWVIVIIASFYGMNASGGSEGVGRSTTSSVVVSIFAVIVLDALFSLIFLI